MMKFLAGLWWFILVVVLVLVFAGQLYVLITSEGLLLLYWACGGALAFAALYYLGRPRK